MEFVAAAREENILVVPGRGFGREGHFRIAYCVSPDTVARALPSWGGRRGAEAAASLRLSPDPESTRLRRQAALPYGFDLSRVIAGNGSDELLAMIARAFVGMGDTLCCPTPTYTLYETLIRIQGGRIAGVPYPEDYSLPAGLAARRGQGTIGRRKGGAVV